MQYAEVQNIAEIFQNKIDYINNFDGFLNLPVKIERLEQIIKTLDLKFNSIDIDSPEVLLNYILTKNHYLLNIKMVRTLLSHKKILNLESFERMNYSYILSTKIQEMIDYIESNIEEYIKTVYLQIDNNTKERIDSYIKLLNNEDLSLELKENIIIKVNTIIDELTLVNDSDVCDLLYKHLKVKPTWNNVLVSFEVENTLNAYVIGYLNSISKSEVFSRIRMTPDKIEGKEKYSALCTTIIYQSGINIEIYKLLIKSIPWRYQTLDFEKISEDRIIGLIENNNIKPSVESYKSLKEHYIGASIILLERNLDKYTELIDELSIDSDDLELILKSIKIGISEKFIFINSCDDEIILNNKENAKMVAQLLVDFETYEARNTLKLSLINNINIPVTIRIKIFNTVISLENKGIINDFLDSLGGEFKKITDTNKKATLENNVL